MILKTMVFLMLPAAAQEWQKQINQDEQDLHQEKILSFLKNSKHLDKL